MYYTVVTQKKHKTNAHNTRTKNYLRKKQNSQRSTPTQQNPSSPHYRYL